MAEKLKLYIVDRWIIIILFLSLPLLSLVEFVAKYTAISALFIIAFAYYYRFKEFRKISISFPLLIWLTLTVYHWVNARNKNSPEVDILDLIHGIKIFACICIFTFLARRNFDQTNKSLIICFQAFLVIAFVLNTIAGTNKERLSGLVIATALGQTAAISGIYIAYYSLRHKLSISRTLLLYALPIVIIILTQSRNSLAMIAIGMLGHAIAYGVQRKLNVGQILLGFLVLGALGLWGFNFIMSNTGLGARLADTETAAVSAQNNNIATGTIFDKIVGDRLVYYVKGWRFFLESPWTGIGMWNYERLSLGNYPLHSEYMVHLAEGGIIGATLWVLFITVVLIGILKFKGPKYIKIVALFSIFEILFCSIYARVFYYEFFYPVFGIALAMSSWGLSSKRNK